MTDTIQTIIAQALPDAHIEVEDPMNDGAHLQATVVSESFVGKSRLQQQRLVMAALKEAFSESLHALALKTYTPEEWNQKN
ncbi:MAG TPA: BolA family transcriptional regulator [Lentisphaeria bacterium]|jgi:acid stress-induced BolA-like protein IbaG/YrbA|nr:BolA family transcriptional regulator [Lentisphaeria bacterium]